jgi:erythronate-4-phosphate dehydrogenase
MRIVADENIPFAVEAFSNLGDVHTVAGRAITRETVADADVLIVRSITKVNAALLEGTPVRFVGTCTIGEDHIDKAWLAAQGIGFSSAPGCNANSVAEYIVGALLHLSVRHVRPLEGLSLGIVGVGNVGSKVARKAEALGLRCVLHDPPLAETMWDAKYRPIEEVLACDIITLHVPLEKTGPHPTRHLVNDDFIARMKPGTLLINTSRGAVVDGAALVRGLERGHPAGCVLDVWENEPGIDSALLDLVDVGTPHIAGYSYDGKVNGTRQIYDAACFYLGRGAAWNPAPLLPEPEVPVLTVYPDEPEALQLAVRAVYDIMQDDADLRGTLALPASERGAAFDRLRKAYRQRREFFNTRVELAQPDVSFAARLAGIGFGVST